ncbi:MAG: LUD domain-containing protein [Chromatiales bacterium]|nr:LUD domain-containing protein [Chromatiales bacterium]
MSKQEILSRIRSALNRAGPLASGVQEGLELRTMGAPTHVRPALDEDPVTQFASKVALVSGTVARCPSTAELSDFVVGYLSKEGLPLDIVTGHDDGLDVQWSNQLAVTRGLPTAADPVSVTAAFAGVAETGTVVMLSSWQSPTTLNFLPATHIVVLKRSRILAHTEEVWSSLRREHPNIPRAVNFITGPSRTGDVEQVLQLGAHGPKRLHVILLEG